MTIDRRKDLNRRTTMLLCIALGSAVLSASLIYVWRAWFHNGDHIAFAQTAAALIFGVPNAFLAIGVAMLSIRATAASEAQAEAAREQASAARAQSALATAQLREAVRPVLMIRRGDFSENATLDSPLPAMEMHNVGVGTACRLRIAHFERGALHNREITASFPMLGSVLPANQSMTIPSIPDEPGEESQNIMIFYESISGDRYCSTYYGEDEAPVLNYEDDPSLWVH